MRIVLFYHSLVSDWNHGPAHFLRGVADELIELGHEVDVYEPKDGCSRQGLCDHQGIEPIRRFHAAYPRLASALYSFDDLDLDAALAGADLVIVHERNDPRLVALVGDHRKAFGKYKLLFHDTGHRSATAPREIAAYDLRNYDGVLAFGSVIRDTYLQRGWARRAWTWHQAADTRIFRPMRTNGTAYDLVWIGNWGDEEREPELREFLIGPVGALKLHAVAHGVGYPQHALREFAAAGIAYRSWIANFSVPALFARAKLTVHVPRRPYAGVLPGIPTIRVFEALACGVPLITSPWDDVDELFRPGEDFLVAKDGDQMRRHLRAVLSDQALANALAARGLSRILENHTCAHRVRELLAIAQELGVHAADSAYAAAQAATA